MDIIRNRFPGWKEVISVFGVVVFAVHSWSVREFLFRLPSFLLKRSAGGILAIFWYHMAFALLESVLVTSMLVIVSGILPSKSLKNGFAYKGFLLILVAAIGAILLQKRFTDGVLAIEFSKVYLLYMGLGLGLILSIGLIILAQKVTALQRLIVAVVEQISVMLLLYLPLGLIGLVMVGIRLLW